MSRWGGAWHAAPAKGAALALPGWYGDGQKGSVNTGEYGYAFQGGPGSFWKGDCGPKGGLWKGDYGQKGGYLKGEFGSSSKGGLWKGDYGPDDWRCPQCEEVNFKRRTWCHKCGRTARPGAGGEFRLPEGQWCVQ